MKNTAKADSLIDIFRQACRPPTPIERLHAYLQAALDCATNQRKTEEIRIAETVRRVRLIASHCDEI